MLSVSVRQHGVLGPEHLRAHGALELVIDSGMHIGNVFPKVTPVSDNFAAIRATTKLVRFVRGVGGGGEGVVVVGCGGGGGGQQQEGGRRGPCKSGNKHLTLK